MASRVDYASVVFQFVQWPPGKTWRQRPSAPTLPKVLVRAAVQRDVGTTIVTPLACLRT